MNEEKTSTGVEVEDTSKRREADNGEPGRPMWITILAVAGILAVLFALGISVFQLATRGSDRFSEITAGLGGLFERTERIVLTVDESTVNSEDEVTFDVEHRNKQAGEDGIYTVEFECEEGVTVTLDGEEVLCNEEIEIGDESPTSFSTTVRTENNRYTDLPVIVRFVGGAEIVETDTLLTIVNSNIASVPTTDDEEDETDDEIGGETDTDDEPNTSKEEPTYITVKRYAGRYSDPNGTADLKVTVDSLGIVRNEKFREQDKLNENDRAAVKFTVINMGTKETGAWYFSAILPTGEPYYFRSKPQLNLLPGDRIEYTLAFDDIEGRGETKLYLHVDPVNDLREVSDLNNVTQAVYLLR